METMTAKEVAELLHLHPQSLRRWRAEGKGPAWMRVGNKCLYRRSDVEQWMEQQVAEQK